MGMIERVRSPHEFGIHSWCPRPQKVTNSGEFGGKWDKKSAGEKRDIPFIYNVFTGSI
jgi:hypothetical protein